MNTIEFSKDKNMQTYISIKKPDIPGLKLDVWCYEDSLGQAIKCEKKEDGLELTHKQGQAKVSTFFKAETDGVSIQVNVTGSPEDVREVKSVNPCCQLENSNAFKCEDKHNYVDDFVARCFVFLDRGMTFLKDTARVPGTRAPRNEYNDLANSKNPWIQEYIPLWRKHPGQIKGERGYSTDRPVYPIIGAVSRDKKYLTAIAWPETEMLGQVWLHCFHARPIIGESYNAKLGETTSFGKIYIIENNEAELLSLFNKDFPDWERQSKK
jgi:hypothetical protein